ncbi:phosphoesterase [Candidatus Nanohaloarchaea archaeon]|nr:phosphoesterase [Candidatus Nanohaloarchaea archaeon]
MNFFEFKTIDSKPGLYHGELDLLVISDLHLGLESSMTTKGSYVPQFQLDDIKRDVEEMQQETEASRILVNGDLKNEFSTSYSEKREIREFIDFLQERFEDVILIKGNHDTLIEDVVEGKDLRLLEKYQEDGVLFTHGHIGLQTLEAEEFETVVIGHEHPALALTDEVGVKEKVDCFLYGEMNEGRNIIVMPAFSTISNGTNINEVPSRELLSPILRNQTDKNSLKAIAVDREAGILEFPEVGRI